jgi:hypothetical protein
MALRVPLLVVGLLWFPWAVVGLTFGSLTSMIALLSWDEGTRGGWWFLFGNGVLTMGTAFLDALISAAMVGYAVLCMVSRGRPERLDTALDLLTALWVLAPVRLFLGLVPWSSALVMAWG